MAKSTICSFCLKCCQNQFKMRSGVIWLKKHQNMQIQSAEQMNLFSFPMHLLTTVMFLKVKLFQLLICVSFLRLLMRQFVLCFLLGIIYF